MRSTGDLKIENINKTILNARRILWGIQKYQYEKEGEMGWKENDIRISTYSKLIHKICAFIIALNSLKYYFDKDIEFGEIFGLSSDYKDPLDPVFGGYFTVMRFDFFIGIFSIFEDAISIILEESLEHDDYLKLFFDPSIILTDQSISDLIKIRFPKQYKELNRREGFPPFERKINKLKEMEFITKEEREFCDFCKCLRNTMHSNGFYSGKNRIFENILGEKFEFINKKPPLFVSLERTLKWANNLVEIFKIISTKTTKDFIKDNAYIPEYI